MLLRLYIHLGGKMCPTVLQKKEETISIRIPTKTKEEFKLAVKELGEFTSISDAIEHFIRMYIEKWKVLTGKADKDIIFKQLQGEPNEPAEPQSESNLEKDIEDYAKLYIEYKSGKVSPEAVDKKYAEIIEKHGITREEFGKLVFKKLKELGWEG